MNIKTAENNVAKLLNYVRSLKESSNSMYSKSKERLRDIASMCGEVVSMISEILQDEALVQEEVEFESCNDSDVESIVKSMKHDMDNLLEFLNISTKNTSEIKPSKSADSVSKIPSQYRRDAIKLYSDALLSTVSVSSSSCKMAKVCSEYLSRWFQIRFIDTVSDHPKFRYNIRRIPRWLISMVVVFGNHIRDGDLDDYLSQFSSWCDKLYSTSWGDKYAVPYEVYELAKESDEEFSKKVSVNSLVLWDVLIDTGLSRLCVEDKYNLYPAVDWLYNTCANNSPESLDSYTYYMNDTSILTRFGLD